MPYQPQYYSVYFLQMKVFSNTITIEPQKQKINVGVVSSHPQIPFQHHQVSQNVLHNNSKLFKFIVILLSGHFSVLLFGTVSPSLVFISLTFLNRQASYFVVCPSIWVCLISHYLIQIPSSSCMSLTQYDWPPSPWTLSLPCLDSNVMPSLSSVELPSSTCWYSYSQNQIAPP